MRDKLLFSYRVLILLTLGTIIFLTTRQTSSDIRNFMFRGGYSGTEQVVSELENYYRQHHTLEGADSIIRDYRGNSRGHKNGPGNGEGNQYGRSGKGMHMRLADAQGKILYDGFADNSETTLSRDEINRAISLNVKGETVGYLLPEESFPFTRENQTFLTNRIIKAVIIASVIAGIASLLLAFPIADKLVKPIVVLTDAARNLAKGKLEQRVVIEGKDEIATLGEAFNQMAAALQQSEETRRALTADIAHELRTPLAVQRAQIEAIKDGIYQLTPEALITIEEQNHLLSRLVEDLRILALADAGALTLEKSDVELVALVQGIIRRFAAQAQEHQITLKLATNPDNIRLVVDPQRIEQILHNLISNALRHSPENTSIEITVSASEKEIRITVRDHGKGIPGEAMPHIFERFYKVEKSRSRYEGGTGLGLSIARKLAQAHGGDITASNHQKGGAIFTLTIPFTKNETQNDTKQRHKNA